MSHCIDDLEKVFASAERMLSEQQTGHARFRLNVCNVVALLDAKGGCERCKSAANYLRRALSLDSQPTNPFTHGGE